MEVNTHFIAQQISAPMAHQIGVYRKGKKVGYVPLGYLAYPDVGEKLYSFGALSDIHLGNTDADTDFQRALTYFVETEKVDFTCICGDLTNYGTESEYEHYKSMVDAYSPNTPVYAVTGNHDATDNDTDYKTEPALTLTDDGITPYTGYPLYYTVSHGDDLFVMVGIRRWTYGQSNTDIFSTEELQWLYDTLEANRDKRCFVFQHALRADGCGWPYSSPWPTSKLLETVDTNNPAIHGTVFKSLVSHYTNVIWFHGHSHTAFDSQEDNDDANYDRNFGCQSVHIPSLAAPREYRDSAYVSMAAESEGYVVDVYANHIVLRGRDFANGQFLPIAQYCLDTTFTPVEEGTYRDPTGTIVTGYYTNVVPLSINADGTLYNGGLGYKDGYRVRSGGAEGANDHSSCTGYIKVSPGDVVRIAGWPFEGTQSGNSINVSDSSFTNLGQTATNGNYGIFAGTYSACSLENSLVTEGNNIYRWVVPPAESGVAYIRISGNDETSGPPGARMIVTINEEIT